MLPCIYVFMWLSKAFCTVFKKKNLTENPYQKIHLETVTWVQELQKTADQSCQGTDNVYININNYNMNNNNNNNNRWYINTKLIFLNTAIMMSLLHQYTIMVLKVVCSPMMQFDHHTKRCCLLNLGSLLLVYVNSQQIEKVFIYSNLGFKRLSKST